MNNLMLFILFEILLVGGSRVLNVGGGEQSCVVIDNTTTKSVTRSEKDEWCDRAVRLLADGIANQKEPTHEWN